MHQELEKKKIRIQDRGQSHDKYFDWIPLGDEIAVLKEDKYHQYIKNFK